MTKYPLTWPTGWKRTPVSRRTRARFSKRVAHSWGIGKGEVTVTEGIKRVLGQLRAFGVQEGDAIISTNLTIRLDGLPYGTQREPEDPGAAVYWRRPDDKAHKVMAIDRYDRIADNLAAIAATLKAMRAIERHGGAVILDRAFTGFEALPAPRDWRVILGVSHVTTPAFEDTRTAYRRLCQERHPDKGGSHEQMAELNWARDQAQEHFRLN